MTDAAKALAQVREALANEALFDPGASTADTYGACRAFGTACTPENMRAILDHVEAQAAEIERLTAERDELRRQLAEAEQRFDWLAERLEDVQIDDVDPNDHYYDGEEDVPFPILWRRAIDAAMGGGDAG